MDTWLCQFPLKPPLHSSLLPLLPRILVLEALSVLKSLDLRHLASGHAESLKLYTGRNLRAHVLQLLQPFLAPGWKSWGLPASPPSPSSLIDTYTSMSIPYGYSQPEGDWSPSVPSIGQECPNSFSYSPHFLSPSAKHSYLKMRYLLLGDPGCFFPMRTFASTPPMARDCPSHSRGLLLPEACIGSGIRVSCHKGKSKATYPYTGDSTAVARSQAGDSGQVGSGGGNNSHGHSAEDTGVGPGSEEPLRPT